MMTLAQLRTFNAVARLNSFSRAAEELHLTQPAVSAQVAALEATLKVKLFDRIGKKFALSGPGHAVRKAAGDILGRVAEMQRELQDLAELAGGNLAIGASQVVGVYLLPELLSGFRQEFPAIDLSVRIESARQVVDLLVRNELDVGIIGEGAPITDDRVAVKPIMRDELIVIVPSNHAFAQMKSIRPTSLAQMPFLLPRRDSALSESMLEQLAREGITLHSVLELGNVGAVKRAVEAGLGIAIVSRCAVLHELEDGRLKSVPVDGMKLERQISLCWHHDRPFSRPTAAFIQYVTARMQGSALAQPAAA